jgi:hypothetical protein
VRDIPNSDKPGFVAEKPEPGIALLIGENGGYICAPAKPIMRDVPLENGLALVESLIRQ